MLFIDGWYDSYDVRHWMADVKTTLHIDEHLVEEAQRLTGIGQKTALVRESLHALIERESARRLALLGGSEPQLQSVPRRKIKPA